MGRVAVPKRRLKTASPRRDATEAPVDWVAVPKTGRGIGQRPVGHRFQTVLPREDGTEVLVGKVAVPKTGQKTASPRGDGSGVPVGRGLVTRVSIEDGLATHRCP